jgi:hypothetical protein
MGLDEASARAAVGRIDHKRKLVFDCALWCLMRTSGTRSCGGGAFIRLCEQYGEESWLACGSGSDERLITLGREGYALLALCGERKVKGKETQAQMLDQDFIFADDGHDPRPRAMATVGPG